MILEKNYQVNKFCKEMTLFFLLKLFPLSNLKFVFKFVGACLLFYIFWAISIVIICSFFQNMNFLS